MNRYLARKKGPVVFGACLLTLLVAASPARAWVTLGGNLDRSSAPTVIERYANGAYYIDIYAIDVNSAVNAGTLTFLSPGAGNATWSGWTNLGGVSLSKVAAFGSGNKREFYVEGTDFALWHQWSLDNRNWSGWASLGKPSTTNVCSAPAVGSFAPPDRQDVFVRGCDGKLWQIFLDGSGWHPWTSLGAPIFRSINTMPTVVAHPGIYDVLVGDNSAHTWDRRWDGSTWTWGISNANGYSPPAGTTHNNDTDAIVRNNSGQFIASHRYANTGTWNGPIASAAIAHPTTFPNSVDVGDYSLVYYRAPAGNIIRQAFQVVQWFTPTQNLDSTPFDTDPTPIVHQGDGTVFVFAIRPDGSMWYSTDTQF